VFSDSCCLLYLSLGSSVGISVCPFCSHSLVWVLELVSMPVVICCSISSSNVLFIFSFCSIEHSLYLFLAVPLCSCFLSLTVTSAITG